jgi:hypothetical protein
MAVAPFLPTNWEQDTVWILPDNLWAEGSFETDMLLKEFPFEYVPQSKIVWDQYANMGGLMPTRALNAPPDVIVQPPLNVFETYPGFYGLESQLFEDEVTLMREPNTVNEPLSVPDRLGVMMLNCSTLVLNRFYQTMGILATSGYVQNFNAAGQAVHTYVVPNFQVFSPNGVAPLGPGWTANAANATPISDLSYWQQYQLRPGTSAKFGADSTLMGNPKMANVIWNTAQVQSTFRSDYGATYKRGNVDSPKIKGDNSIEELMLDAGLPALTLNDTGFYPTLDAALTQQASNWQYTIPDNTLTWIGKRPGNVPIGQMKLTKHAGINAYQADKFPTVKVENESYAELTKGIFVIAKYHDMMPQHYTIQVGVNFAPIIGYFRGIAGFQTG